MKRIIVTGATGFVGANLTRRLLREGHEIHLLVRPGYNAWRIQDIMKSLYLHEVNFLDKDALMRVIANIRPDWVFHLAAYGAYSWQTDLSRMVQTNIISTINLVESCLKCGFEAFVNTGSSSEYGFKDHAASEIETLEPNSHYAVTKATATMFCRYSAKSHGVHMPTLRLYSVYGPYEDPNRLIPTLILKGLEGKFPPLVKPDISHDFIYIDDVVEAYLLAVQTRKQEPGAIYNVGTGVQTSLREVVRLARQIMKIEIEPEWGTMPERRWDFLIWIADNRRIKEEIGWVQNYTFEQGFQRTVEWTKENYTPLFYQNQVSNFKI